MAKGKGNKFKRNRKNIGQPNAKIRKKVPKIGSVDAMLLAPAHHSDRAEATASYSALNRSEGVTLGNDEKREQLAGFIFMCSSNTKSECYRYRVFGLPMGKMNAVQMIKPGTKLFLFDFELKILYGIYEATSTAQLDLEPSAFRGKFPVQVKFRIFKECLPLPESSLRRIIKENYKGSKFNQELHGKQVGDLLSTFLPLDTPSQVVPRVQSNVLQLQAIRHSVTEDPYKHPSRLLGTKDQYLTGLPYGHAPQLLQPHIVPEVHFAQQGDQRTVAYVDRLLPTLDRQGFSVASNYHVTDARQPYITEYITNGVQDPYMRYRNIHETVPHVQGGGIINEAAQYIQGGGILGYQAATSFAREGHQLPLQSGVPYQTNASASYIPAFMLPHAATELQGNSSVFSSYVHAGATWTSQ